MRSHLRSLKDFKIFLNGTADVSQLHELRTQLKRLLSPVDLQRLLPKGGPTTTPKLHKNKNIHQHHLLDQAPVMKSYLYKTCHPASQWSMLLTNLVTKD